ncbi:nucleoside hydrolase-like domain-containing protein [Sphingomonas sp. Root710]|uniref:nucleoside hydrolase-like domain-containing protein n=1 Tax=Sphingomonas sp. Root710 TaxID=1736594 RepID=UPI0009ECB9D1|nr:nucleoside hydrolase-like domain-containing protein [Sphingomonas sp. Root710]
MANSRVFITTDLQMISGVNLIDGDKDDVQSLIHSLLYQDKYEIVGIASSTSAHQPGKNSADLIHRVIDTYAKDRDALAAHGSGFKTADQLHAITYQGTKYLAGSSGLVAPTAASAAIIKAARAAEDDGVPLYVTAWGGVGDIARALHDAPDIADNIRLLSVSGKVQEPNAHAYISAKFAGKGELWWINEASTHRGVYGTPDSRDPISDAWALANAKGHGALGTMFYDNTQDVRGLGGTVDGMKMGDSHTIFYLIDSAKNDDPTAESWGGEYRKIGDKLWTDRTDGAFNWTTTTTSTNGAHTIYEDRAAWTSDFAKRLDWLKDTVSTTAPIAPTTSKVGTSGNDSMLGTSANDTLSGGAGHDTLDGAGGSDRMAGGTGNDAYYLRQTGDVVVENAGEGTDLVHAYVNTTLSANVENMNLRTAASINGTGNGLANNISGNSGRNVIDGKGSNDTIYGAEANDTIIGNTGNDRLAGGTGNDLFIFRAGDGDDVITDFVAGGTDDRLQIMGYTHYDAKTQVGADTLLTFSDDSILLRNVDARDLTGADFLFA